MHRNIATIAAALAMGMTIMTSITASDAATPAFKMDKLPYKAAWGPYTVSIDANMETPTFPTQLLRLRDSSGKVLREVDSLKFIDLRFVEMTGTGSLELFVTAFDGGAHCCSKSFIFTQDGGLKNLLILDLGNGHVEAIKDLNNDKRAEIIATNDSLTTLDIDLYYAITPVTYLVVGWDGKRFGDLSRRYPEVARPLVRQYQSEFEKVEGIEGTIYGEDAEFPRRGAALGYYANSLLIGEGDNAKAWLREHAPESTLMWLAKNDLKIQKAISSVQGKIRVSQKARLSGWRIGDHEILGTD